MNQVFPVESSAALALAVSYLLPLPQSPVEWRIVGCAWHTCLTRGEVAEPGLRRTPGERVNSEGFRGFKSPPLRHHVVETRSATLA